MPQTTFNVSPPNGIPGTWADAGPHWTVDFPAHVDCPFGVLLEIVVVSGVEMVQPVQDTGTTTTFLPVVAGVSVYSPIREQGYQTPGLGGQYKAGEMVPCARRGKIWVAFDGTGSWPSWAAVRVNHSSDGSHAQGVFTMHAAQTTAGNEIDTAPAGIIGVEASDAFTGYTDGFGNAISAAKVSLNLG